MTLLQVTSDPPMNTILYPSSASGGHNMNLRLAFHCLLLHKPLKVMYSLLMVDSLLKGCGYQSTSRAAMKGKADSSSVRFHLEKTRTTALSCKVET